VLPLPEMTLGKDRKLMVYSKARLNSSAGVAAMAIIQIPGVLKDYAVLFK